MANSNLKTLSEIFNDKIFRIPDYQRGYSWGEAQLEDLWRDIDNLPMGKSHYTGMITVDIQDEKIYHVIDGQQRLTSLVIFLKNILDKYDDEWITDDLEKSEAIKKYLYSKIKNSKNPKIIFGYKDDNSSYYHYKTKILNIEDKANKNSEKTLYTTNLDYANNFLEEKLKNKSAKDLEMLFIKVTSQLKFNLYEIEKSDDLDEYIIFETMNNRGKPLSVLEILKNRLIYIVTLLDDNDEDKNKLRNDINDVWKTIFEYLGKDKRIDEITFLENHSIMYFGEWFTESELEYRNYLLNNIFNIQKVYSIKDKKDKIDRFDENLQAIKISLSQLKKLNFSEVKNSDYLFKEIFEKAEEINKLFISNEPLICNEFYDWEEETDTYKENYAEELKLILECKEELLLFKEKINRDIKDIEENQQFLFLQYNFIEDYVSSLKESIVSYYNVLNYPLINHYSDDIKYWLYKINNLNINTFLPLLLSIFNNYNLIKPTQVLSYLEKLENLLFIKNFTNHTVTGKVKEVNALGYHYKKYNEIREINLNKYGSHKQIFNSKQFIKFINKQFDYNNGYYSWSGLLYVLYEYEVYLQSEVKGSKKILWEDVNKESIEHILPQTLTDDWKNDFENFDDDTLKHHQHSIGNLLLLSKHRNSKASNKSFKNKKEIFSTGSFSEIEVGKSDQWTTKEIDERSEKILKFMNERWHLGLKVADINKLK